MWITPSGDQKPSSIAYVDGIARHPDDYRVLERMPLNGRSPPFKFEGADNPVRRIAILDTETTGVEQDDAVIELSIVRCGVDSFNRLCTVDEIYDEFIYTAE